MAAAASDSAGTAVGVAGRKGPKRAFVERDYSRGTAVRFEEKFPRELEGRVDEQAFLDVICRINAICDEAEHVGCASCLEGTLAWLTLFTIHMCTRTNYEKCLDTIADFVRQKNATLFSPKGVTMVDPMERGLRVIEFVIDHIS